MSQPNRSWKRSRAQSCSPCQRHVGVGGALTPTPTAYQAFSFHKAVKAIGSNSQQPKGGSNPRAHRQGGRTNGTRSSRAGPEQRPAFRARELRRTVPGRAPASGSTRPPGRPRSYRRRVWGCQGLGARPGCSRGTGFQRVETERLAAQWRACRTVRLVLPA